MTGTGVTCENYIVRIWIKGVEVARIKPNGDIDINGVVNQNAF